MRRPVGDLLGFLRGRSGRATAGLIALRIAYAYNWFDVGPGLPGISATYGVGPGDWGILIAGFLGGAGLFQVPAGLLARRWGPRKVSFLGIGLLGAAGVGAALAPTFEALVAMRVAAGAGAALFFSPAIGLVAALQPAGRRGVAVGTFSSAFSAGAALGVFVTALLIPEVGWQGSLAFGGLLLLGLLAVTAPLVPPDPAPAPPGRGLPAALRSRAVWAIGFAFVGVEGSSVSAGQYFVPFAEIVHGWAPALAGAIASLFVFPSLFGGPVGGALTERSTRRRTQLVAGTLLSGTLLLFVPFVGLPAVAVLAVVFSLSYGALYAMMYVLAPYLPGIPPQETPLAIGLFNAIQIAGGAVVAFLFAVIVAASSYTFAWIALGLASIAPLPLLAWVPRTPVEPGP